MKTKTFIKLFSLSICTLLICTTCQKKESKIDSFTQNFYIFSVDGEEQCGYLLFEDRGSPGLYHDGFVWVKKLPKEYQEYLLPVTVTFHYTEEKCGSYPIINIIKIQKQ